MQDLKITLIQSDIYWEEVDANLSAFEEKIWQIGHDTDVIVLPEMFTTGFSMDAQKNAETMEGPSVDWLKKTACDKNTFITGSLIIKEQGYYFNRLLWVSPEGAVDYYDKYNLFTLAEEDHHFSKGQKRRVFEIKKANTVWKICPLICYDLRFPVWSRNTENFDVLLYVANFPAKRTYAWSHLLISRAIENQCYVAGVNRLGEDGVGLSHDGSSAVIDYAGYPVIETKNEPGLFTAALLYDKRLAFCKAYNFLNDIENFEMKGI